MNSIIKLIVNKARNYVGEKELASYAGIMILIMQILQEPNFRSVCHTGGLSSISNDGMSQITFCVNSAISLGMNISVN